MGTARAPREKWARDEQKVQRGGSVQFDWQTRSRRESAPRTWACWRDPALGDDDLTNLSYSRTKLYYAPEPDPPLALASGGILATALARRRTTGFKSS